MEHSICPYDDGNILTLQIYGETNLHPHPTGPIECKILKYYRLSTLSCVMQVEIDTLCSQGKRFILKLYDHRFATQLRADEKVEPFTPLHQTAYWDFVESGRASNLLAWLEEDESLEEDKDLEEDKSWERWPPQERDWGQNEVHLYNKPLDLYDSEYGVHNQLQDLQGTDRFWKETSSEKWGLGQNEVYLYSKCLDLYDSECRAYDQLQDLQGNDIPRLIAKVRLPLASPPSIQALLPAELHEIKGVLLEFIDGFTLLELMEKAPKEAWQNICDQAIRVVHSCNDRKILNEDVQPSNVMVTTQSQSQAEKAYRVVILDFAQCRIREPEESDEEWGRAKWVQDEEGAIGQVMKSRLKKVGFDLVYNPSLRYLEWASGEDD
ncbi:MAG: hypothetical protein Q9187_008471 [Circinaria calcarea]